jgi:coatomer subunit epsilon
VVSATKGQSSPDFKALAIAAEFLKKPSETSPAVDKAKKLADSDGGNMNVQILCGTVLARAGDAEAALALLSKHQGSLDA